jgi:hypothetical protein
MHMRSAIAGFFLGLGAAIAAVLLAGWGLPKADAPKTPNPAEIAARAGVPNIQLPPGVVSLDITYQKANEKGTWQNARAGDHPVVLQEGDKVQFKVNVGGQAKRYLYLYWYDTQGKPDRLWPTKPDLDKQQSVAEVMCPVQAKNWYSIDSTQGCEMALAFARELPLSREELGEFERQTPFNASRKKLEKAFRFNSYEPAEQQGLISTSFAKQLRTICSAYDGIVIPHQP